MSLGGFPIAQILSAGAKVVPGPRPLAWETVAADPNGTVIRPAGSIAVKVDGSVSWINVDGASEWLEIANDPSGLKTTYEVDFRTLPAQDLLTGGDGSKVIDDKTWTAVNVDKCSGLAIVPGVGLRFIHAAVAAQFSITGGTDVAPRLRIPISDLGARFQTARSVWVWMLASNNSDQSAEATSVGIRSQPPSTALYNMAAFIHLRQFRTGIGISTRANQFFNASNEISDDPPDGAVYDVAVLRFRDFANVTYYYGAHGGQFPARQNLVEQYIGSLGQLNSNLFLGLKKSGQRNNLAVPALNLVSSQEHAGAGFTSIIQKIKIEVDTL